MSLGLWLYYGSCAVAVLLLSHYTFPPRAAEHRAAFKGWLLHKLEPWYEERASLDLSWRVFARKHNAGGNRPLCAYDGWEAELNEDDRAEVYEFPGGDPDAHPDCLQNTAIVGSGRIEVKNAPDV